MLDQALLRDRDRGGSCVPWSWKQGRRCECLEEVVELADYL